MENLITVYEIPWLIEYVHRKCESTRVVNTDKLEDRVIGKLADFIRRYPEQRGNRKTLSRWTDKYVAYLSSEKFRNDQSSLFSEIVTKDDEGKEAEYEPVDVLANVESEVVAKRTIDLLAQADRRKLVILNEWANGNTIDSDISLALAREIGGNPESHRKAIHRFRIECRRALDCAAI